MAMHKDKKKPMKKKHHHGIEIEIEMDHKDKKKKKEPAKKKHKMMDKSEKKIKKVMHEFGEGKLHSGSKKGPVVTNPKQAVAIGYAESKRKKK